MRLHLVIYRHDFPPVRILSSASTPPALSDQPSAASSFTVGGSYPPALSSARRGSVSTSFNTAQTSFTSRRSGSFGPSAHGFTIAQLLQDVNERVPLETQPGGSVSDQDVGHWGLEDYVVEVFGSECLHYLEVESLLRDGDEVVIRPLEADELTARRMAGRHQRAADGTHLIDGVQFGRRYDARLGPSRPSIAIPPRKRRQVDNGALEDDRSAMSMNYAIDWPGRDQEDAPRNRVMTVNTVGQSRQNSLACPPILEQERERKATNIPSLLERQPLDPAMLRSSSTMVHQQLNDEMDLDVPKAAKSTTPMLTTEESGNAEASDASSDSSENESSQEKSDSGESSGDSSSSVASAASASDSSASSSSSESSDSDSESESESESDSADDQPKTASKLAKLSPPGEGSRKTRNSNDRTKMRRKLAKLKELGILHKDANFSELRTWIAAHGNNAVPYVPTHIPGETTAEMEQPDLRKKQGFEAGDTEVIPNKGMEVNSSQRKKAQFSEKGQSDFEKKRAQLLQDLQNGGVDITPSNNGRAKTPLRKKMKLDSAPTAIKGGVATLADTLAEPLSETEVSKKKAKLDMAGARRLLFGSLGVRTPKTKEEEEITRNKLAAKAAPPNRIPKEKSPEAAEDAGRDTSVLKPVENWQDVLMLKATECVHDVVLSDPPFPFVQRWNSEDQEAIRACRANSNNTGTKGKKRKRKSRRSDFAYEEDEYEEHNNYDYTEGSLLLDYDETQVSNSPMAPVQRSLVDITVNPLNESSKECSTDDLPLLFRDVFTRPLADESEIVPGAIIAFKQLDMSKDTNWEPVVSDYRTAIVEEIVESSTFRVCLAKRDRVRQVAEDEDNDSPRVYSKFEMPGYNEDADEDDGIREVTFQELIEPKLLRPGASTAPSAVPAVEVEESPAVETPDIIPESVPVNKLPVVVDTPLSSQTRNDISNMIHDAGFRSTIDSDLLIPDVHPGFSEAQLPEDIDEEADIHMSDADANSVASETPLPEGFDEKTENPMLDADANSIIPEAQQPEEFDEEAKTSTLDANASPIALEAQPPERIDEEVETPKLNADDGSPAIGTPTFDGFDESEFPDISIFSPGGKKGTTNSSRNSPSATKETQNSASGNNASSHIAGQRMNPENPLSLNPSDDGLTYLTDDLTLGLRPQDDDAQPRLGVPPDSSPPSFQPKQVSLSDSQEDEEDGSQISTLPDIVGGSPLTGRRRGSNASSTGSTVPNPFYYTDRKNAGVEPDSAPAFEPFASTAPARLATENKRKRRKALSSPRKASTPPRKPSNSPSPSPSPQPFLSFSDDDDDSDLELKLPAETAAEKKSTSPVPSQLSENSLLEGSQLSPVDLTFSSDPVSPGNSDGDFAATQGLPRGPGWVKKNYPQREWALSTRLTITPPARRARGRGRGRGRRSVI